MLDVTIPAFIGRVVGLVSTHAPADAAARDLAAASRHGRRAAAGCGRWCSSCHVVLINQIVNPGLSNMIRWQNHWHVVRQSWTFFQNDFAGRIANRVHADRPVAAREPGDGVRRRLVHHRVRQQRAGAAGLGRLAPDAADPAVVLRATPACCVYFVPRLRERSRAVSEMRSHAHRPRGRQLHQHPDGQAVRPRARRGRVRARGDRSTTPTRSATRRG